MKSVKCRRRCSSKRASLCCLVDPLACHSSSALLCYSCTLMNRENRKLKLTQPTRTWAIIRTRLPCTACSPRRTHPTRSRIRLCNSISRIRVLRASRVFPSGRAPKRRRLTNLPCTSSMFIRGTRLRSRLAVQTSRRWCRSWSRTTSRLTWLRSIATTATCRRPATWFHQATLQPSKLRPNGCAKT